MLTQIFTFHQVMPAYLDFVSVFGRQEEPRDLHFGGFREAMTISKSFGKQWMPSRSGRQYQICFNLKGVTRKENTLNLDNEASENLTSSGMADTGNYSGETEYEWSIRQAAFYHQFDIVNGTTLWIVTKGGLDIQQLFKDLTSKQAPLEGNSFDTPSECFQSSLVVHLMYCHWSLEDWRGYLRWLEDIVDQEVRLHLEQFLRRG
jgi:hypothetical protein